MPNVLWWDEKERGSWGCTNVLNEIFDLYECEHFVGKEGVCGGVLVLHGGNAQLYGRGPATAREINETVSTWPWVIFIVVGDEATEFCSEQLEHPNSRLWVQTPLPATRADRYLIEGYPRGTRGSDFKDRDIDVFFSGQDTHVRRHECIAACARISDQLLVWSVGTQGFSQGMSQEGYLDAMSRAKIALCPSGPASPDTFRIWEALECRAVPIVDARSLRDETVGFWDAVLGPDHPLPLIEDWSMLPVMVEGILADYERYQRLTQFWWKKKKLEMREWLAQDMIALGAMK